MVIFFLILVVISALLLILMVMLQDEQGEGLGGIFGGGSGTPFGSRAGNVLTRITAVLAVAFISCTLILALLNRTPALDSTIDTARQEQYEEGTAAWFINTEGTDTDSGSSLLMDATDLPDTDAVNIETEELSGENAEAEPENPGEAG